MDMKGPVWLRLGLAGPGSDSVTVVCHFCHSPDSGRASRHGQSWAWLALNMPCSNPYPSRTLDWAMTVPIGHRLRGLAVA